MKASVIFPPGWSASKATEWLYARRLFTSEIQAYRTSWDDWGWMAEITDI